MWSASAPATSRAGPTRCRTSSRRGTRGDNPVEAGIILPIPWTIETFGPAVDAELRALPIDATARLTRYLKDVEQNGPGALPPKAAKHLDGKLCEIRLTGRDGIARVIYVTAAERRVVLLRAFVKKTEKTPGRDLNIARQRARLVK